MSARESAHADQIPDRSSWSGPMEAAESVFRRIIGEFGEDSDEAEPSEVRSKDHPGVIRIHLSNEVVRLKVHATHPEARDGGHVTSQSHEVLRMAADASGVYSQLGSEFGGALDMTRSVASVVIVSEILSRVAALLPDYIGE